MLQFQHKQICLRFWECIHGGRRQWAVYYTSPKSFTIIFSWGLVLNFDCLAHKVECPNVSTTNCNLQRE